MGKKNKCCDRYKKKEKYCSGCPIVDSCELAPRPDADEERKRKEEAGRGRPPCRPEEEIGKKEKKSKKEKSGRKDKKDKKDKREKNDKKDKKDKKDK